MPQDSIQILIQCEKEAKEMIQNAKIERVSLKQRAREDAQEIIMAIKTQRQEDLKQLVLNGEAKIKIEEKKIKAEYEIMDRSIDCVLEGKESLLNLVVDRICNSHSDITGKKDGK